MKRLLLAFLLVAGVSLGVKAQDKEKVDPASLPQPVQTAFKNTYANATDVEWKMRNGMYRAKFKMGETKRLAEFDVSGTIVQKGQVIPISEVPTAITTAVQAANANRSIEEVYKIEKGTEVNYLVWMSGTPEKAYLYSADGKLMKEAEKVDKKN